MKRFFSLIICIFRGHYFPRVDPTCNDWTWKYCGRCGAYRQFDGSLRFGWVVEYIGKKYIDGIEWVRA